MRELWSKILEALISALPITAIVYVVALLPWFDFSVATLIAFGIGAVMLILGIGLFNMGADLAMTPMGTHVGAGLSKQRKLWLLLTVCFVLSVLVVLAEPTIHVLNGQVEEVTGGYITKRSMLIGLCVGVGSAIALAVVRIIFDFSLVWYIVPGYFISLALSLVVPPMYTAVAFDSGGVAKEDAAAFFGITIHAEKEILMMAVEKEIRDQVLDALYKEMGMGKQAQGIAFSLPVSDVAGLVKEQEKPAEAE